ncbi:Ig-like domain-containing protein [Bacteroidales bacterium OttesenSCG-928-A17]|nr:Ig-like domain-containing protein [Bacteroidales bacterium OttesenSCG-928-A17]
MKRTITTGTGKFFLLFLMLLLAGFLPITAQDLPIPQKGDVLFFSGGSVDPNNPDIYTIDMGEPELGEDAASTYYPIEIHRPGGIGVNYPVSVFYEWNSGSMSVTAAVNDKMQPYRGGAGGGIDTLTFAPGVMAKTIYVNIPNGGEMRGSKEAMYIFFSPLMRTKTMQPVLELVFTNPNPVDITTPQVIEGCNRMGPLVNYHGTGQYVLMKFEYLREQNSAETQFTEIKANQKLAVTEYHLDHDNLPYGSPEMSNPNSLHQVMVSPRLVNTTHTNVVFLHKITENAVVTDYQEGNEGKRPIIQYKPDFITGILPAGGNDEVISINLEDYVPDQYEVDHSLFNFFPRFGDVTSNKSSYAKNEVVTLSVPFHNAKLYQKVYGSNWLNHIFFTLDGGGSFLANHPNYDAATGNLSISFNAPNHYTKNTTLYPEIGIRRYETDAMTYPLGGFTPITVTTNTAQTVYTSSITVNGLPERNRVFIGKKPHTVLSHKVLPENCSFLNAVWSSSDTDILEITNSGELIPKAPGTVTITLTSDEVGYRASEGMSANNGVLIKTFTITVKNMPELQPKIETQRKLAYESVMAKFTQDIIASGWRLTDKPSTVVITHDDAKYDPVTLNPTWGNDLDTSGEFELEIPFDDRTFPRRNSVTNPETSLFIPICTADITIPVVDANETSDTLMLTASCPIYLLPYIYPKIIGHSELNVVYAQDQLQYGTFKHQFEIENLDKQFTLELVVSRTTYNDFSDELIPQSYQKVYNRIFDYPMHELPGWITLEDQGDTYNAKINFGTDADARTVPAGSYYKYIYDLYVRSLNIPGEEGKVTARSYVHVYNTEFDITDGLDITYQVGKSTVGPSTSINDWVDNNDQELERVNNRLQNMLFERPIDILMGFGSASQYRTINRMHYPEHWGPCIISSSRKNNKSDTQSIAWPDQKKPIHLKFPKPDTTYTFTISFPKIGASKEFSYRWKAPRIDNIRQVEIRRIKFYPGTVSFIHKGDVSKTKFDLGEDKKTHFYLSFLSESDTIGVNVSGGFYHNTSVIAPCGFRHLDIRGPSADMDVVSGYLDYVEKAWYAPSWFATPTYQKIVYLTTDDPKLDIYLYNEEGEPITSNAYVNFMSRTYKSKDFVMSGRGVEAENGVASISLWNLKNSSANFFQVYVEVIAEGYTPQVIEFDYKTGFAFPVTNIREGQVEWSWENARYYYSLNQKTKAILKKGEKKYSNILLRYAHSEHSEVEDKEAEFVQMQDLSLQSFTPYHPAKFNKDNQLTQVAYLDVDLVWPKEHQAMATIASSSKSGHHFHSVWAPRYLTTEFSKFENDYFVLHCKLYQEASDGEEEKYFSDPQDSAQVYVYSNNVPLCQLPGLVNADPVPDPVEYSAPSAGDIKTDKANENTNLGDSKEHFNTFNIETLESLPFCIEITKNKNEWIIRGALEIDVLSKDALNNKIDDGNFKDKFKNLKDKLKYDTGEGTVRKNAGVSVTILGYLEGKGTYNASTGKVENITFSAGGIGIAADAKVFIKKTYLVGEFGVELKGSLSSRVDFFKSESRTETFNVDLVFDNMLGLSLRAWGMVGFDAWVMGAQVGVEGTAWASMTHRLERLASGSMRDGLKFKLGASIDLFAVAWLGKLKFSWDHNLVRVEKTYLVPDDTTNPFNEPIGTRSSTPTMELFSKSYREADLRSASPDLTPLVTGVLENTNPRYVGEDNFVFSYIGDPKEYDDDRIKVYDGSSSSNIVPTATTSANSFNVATANGKSVVAYEQLRESVSSEDLEDMDPHDIVQMLSPKNDIIAAVNNDGTWKASKISDNDLANINPIVAISDDGSKAAVAWSSGKIISRELSDENSQTTQYYMGGKLLLSRFDGTS